jgi:heptosyltransferase III
VPQQAPKSPSAPVVIYRLGSLGDAIVALPCFHRVAQIFPDAERVVLTNVPVASVAPPFEAVLGRGHLVSQYVAYPVGLRSLKELWSLRARLKAIGASTLVYMGARRGLLSAWRDLIFFRLCGFSRIVGIPLTQELQENRVDPATGFVEPECERLARALASLGPIDLKNLDAWDLMLSAEELAMGEKFVSQFGGSSFIAIHVGGKATINDWGEKNWRMLLRELEQKYGDYGLMLVGAQDDSRRYDAIVDQWAGPVANACGKLTPRECAAAMRFARIFIGHDSGPLHLASISGAPCVGLFGKKNLPRKWHPYIGTTRIVHRVGGIERISVAEVADAVRNLLAETQPRKVA